MNTYTDADVFHFNQFKVWRLKGVADDRGVITKVQARLLSEDIPVLDAVAELGEPDPVLVQKFLTRNPESGQYLFRHSEDDATGFLASDRVERKHLAEWTWAVLDKDALEAQGLANWWEIIAARRAEKGKAPDPVKTLTEIQANIANGLRPKVQEDLGGMPGEFGAGVSEKVDSDEPMPDPLREIAHNLAADQDFMAQFAVTNPEAAQRLREPNPPDEAWKDALMQRFIDLQGLQSLKALSPAGWADFKHLTQYAGWFK